MKKKFNITGICFPHLHYMMDTSAKLKQTMEMVEMGEYFVINRPRQYGKTTMLGLIQTRLSQFDEYLTIKLNFQGIDSQWHESDKAFARMFFDQIINYLSFQDQIADSFLKAKKDDIHDMNSLSFFITQLALKQNKRLVLLIDEVDASSNYEPFLNFLGMLRNKYLARFEPQHATFHSIVLAGVHDIKSLKFKLRNPESAHYNSPWNIAADFDVDMSFHPHEIAPMLEDYGQAEGVKMDIPAIAERLYYHTSGYPFLISKLCKIIAEKILPKTLASQWTLDDVEAAVQLLLQENNTNFDSLIKNLENHQDLYDLVYKIVIEGAHIAFNQYNPHIQKGILYGIFKRNGQVKIQNRIYEQLIYDYMASRVEVGLKTSPLNLHTRFILPTGGLDLVRVLRTFQQFIKEQYSEKDLAFLEREWRLIFLAFLQPILNGNGYTFKEVQISEEKRLDVVITYKQFRYIVELKRWYGPSYHERGLNQLADYLDIHSQDTGYLVIFDHKRKKVQEQEETEVKGKRIFAVWV